MRAASNSDITLCLSKKPGTFGHCCYRQEPMRPSIPVSATAPRSMAAAYAAIDPCVGDGTALIEITKDTGGHLTGIELDADRAAAAAGKGIATVHGSAFECRVLAETC